MKFWTHFSGSVCKLQVGRPGPIRAAPPTQFEGKTSSQKYLCQDKRIIEIISLNTSNPPNLVFCFITMSRSRSMKTKKQRHGRRTSTKSAKPAAKPASPVPVYAKPEVDSTSLPKSSENQLRD